MDHLSSPDRTGGQHLVGQLEPDTERDESLLPAVMEVSLDAAALVVRRDMIRAREARSSASDSSTWAASLRLSYKTKA